MLIAKPLLRKHFKNSKRVYVRKIIYAPYGSGFMCGLLVAPNIMFEVWGNFTDREVKNIKKGEMFIIN